MPDGISRCYKLALHGLNWPILPSGASGQVLHDSHTLSTSMVQTQLRQTRRCLETYVSSSELLMDNWTGNVVCWLVGESKHWPQWR